MTISSNGSLTSYVNFGNPVEYKIDRFYPKRVSFDSKGIMNISNARNSMNESANIRFIPKMSGRL